MNEETAHDTQEFLTKRLTAIKNQRSTGELEELALIIGASLYCCTSISLILWMGQMGRVWVSPSRRRFPKYFSSSPLCARLSYAVRAIVTPSTPFI